MDDLSTYQGALQVFRNVKCAGGRQNCLIGAIVDLSKSSEFTGAMIGNGAFGAVGYVIGDLIGRERDLRVSRIYDFIFVMIDFTETGVGIIPLRGGGMRFSPEKLTPCYDAFVFFLYQELKEITVKNYYGIRKSVKTISIVLADGKKLCFTANMEEKALPYQQNGMATLVASYQK